jgi:hypothetical protein
LDQVYSHLADIKDLFEWLANVLANEHFAPIAVLYLVAFGQRNCQVRFYFFLEVQNIFRVVHRFLCQRSSLHGCNHSGFFGVQRFSQQLRWCLARSEELEATFKVWFSRGYRSKWVKRCP